MLRNATLAMALAALVLGAPEAQAEEVRGSLDAIEAALGARPPSCCARKAAKASSGASGRSER